MSLISIAHASEAATNATIGTGSSLMSLLPMVLIFAIFYFFLIRPQVKKQRAVEAMIAELKKGDRVVAAGGLYGIIHKIEGNIIYLEIADNVRIKILKTSVTELLNKDEKSSEAAVEKPALTDIKKLDKESTNKVAKPAKAAAKPTTKPKAKK